MNLDKETYSDAFKLTGEERSQGNRASSGDPANKVKVSIVKKRSRDIEIANAAKRNKRESGNQAIHARNSTSNPNVHIKDLQSIALSADDVLIHQPVSDEFSNFKHSNKKSENSESNQNEQVTSSSQVHADATDAPIDDNNKPRNEPSVQTAKTDKSSSHTPRRSSRTVSNSKRRVRFKVPGKTGSTARMALSADVRRKRQPPKRKSPSFVPTLPNALENTREYRNRRQGLLDELQYLLDGIFQSKKRANQSATCLDLTNGSLKALVALLLSKKKRGTTSDGSILLTILATQPSTIKKIASGLLNLLGRSLTTDFWTSFVLAIIFREIPDAFCIEDYTLDPLIGALFKNSTLACKADVKGEERNSSNQNDKSADESQPRAKFGRKNAPANDTASMDAINELIMQSGLLEEDGLTGFKSELQATTYFLGYSLSNILSSWSDVRFFMRAGRRLDTIVAILYFAVSFLKKQTPRPQMPINDLELKAVDIEKNRSVSIVLAVVLRVLEYATVDPPCLARVSKEAKICNYAVALVHAIAKVEGGIYEAELILSNACKMFLHLTHHCDPGLKSFIETKGIEAIMDCVTVEGQGCGLLAEKNPGDQVQMFDVRVLSLFVLANVVYEGEGGAEIMCNTSPLGIDTKDCNSVGVLVEMFKAVDKGYSSNPFSTEGNSSHKGLAMEDTERKITLGYICLLLGTISYKSRDAVEILDKKLNHWRESFVKVLNGFLKFMHEVGVKDQSIDKMYKDVISHLLK